MIASNHQALYIKFLVYGVGDVSCPESKIVPVAIATAKRINNTAVSLVEKKILASFFCIRRNLFKGFANLRINVYL